MKPHPNITHHWYKVTGFLSSLTVRMQFHAIKKLKNCNYLMETMQSTHIELYSHQFWATPHRRADISLSWAMQRHHIHVPRGGLTNSCITRATPSIKHHQRDVLPSQELRRRSDISCTAPGVAVTHGKAISTCASSQGSHTSCASSSPDKRLCTKAVTPPPAPEALIPCASQANPAATKKGCGRGGPLQFKILLTSFIQLLTYGLILSKMPRAMRILSLVYNNTTKCQ